MSRHNRNSLVGWVRIDLVSPRCWWLTGSSIVVDELPDPYDQDEDDDDSDEFLILYMDLLEAVMSWEARLAVIRAFSGGVLLSDSFL